MMSRDALAPRLGILRQEYVLVQAWKKTAAHIRYHNWYADTLELDLAAVNLRKWLSKLSEDLASPSEWKSENLRLVPAPKSERWKVSDDVWGPAGDTRGSNERPRFRPLAHVSLRDQVAATAIMLCLADIVETSQGDPQSKQWSSKTALRTISLGNRLYCDVEDGRLEHRWGSAKLYRSYYQDYRTFLERPGTVAARVRTADMKAVVVHTDLKQFYDRVRPPTLRRAIAQVVGDEADEGFMELAERVLNWRWAESDAEAVAAYARKAQIKRFSHVALPQGLVAAGFFANLVLGDFDESIRRSLSKEIGPKIVLRDACRYVDDMRFVLAVPQSMDPIAAQNDVTAWVSTRLRETAPGLSLAIEKTTCVTVEAGDRPIVPQGRRMSQIQVMMSGGFDAAGGEQILEGVQSLVRAQQEYSIRRALDDALPISPVVDVRDETVARFAAARFRTTFRALRPLLQERSIPQNDWDGHDRRRVFGSQEELDNDARLFAYTLVEKWISDPANVRLLRVGLDIWPAASLLSYVLKLLRDRSARIGDDPTAQNVAWYCFGEVFRAGATETGIVNEQESLPAVIDLTAYRDLLATEARRILGLNAAVVPWFVRQQAILYLIVQPNTAAIALQNTPEVRHYARMLTFLQNGSASSQNLATFAILARRSFRTLSDVDALLADRLTPCLATEIAAQDPDFARELQNRRADLVHQSGVSGRSKLRRPSKGRRGKQTLEEIVADSPSRLRNEQAVLKFIAAFLAARPKSFRARGLRPKDIVFADSDEIVRGDPVFRLEIGPPDESAEDSIYSPPAWCAANEIWRFQLGYLLRFILTANEDFTSNGSSLGDDVATRQYRVPRSHFVERLYGMYSGHDAFHDRWLPISDWTERLLYSLLRWPGASEGAFTKTLRDGPSTLRRKVVTRLNGKWGKLGASSGLAMLPLSAPCFPGGSLPRQLRGCVVQTAIPSPAELSTDPTCSQKAIRKRHRAHLYTALEAVKRALDLRETLSKREGRLDLLILPELAVHPDDIQRQLVPFARAYKTIILAGLTYHRAPVDGFLRNAAAWVVPEMTPKHGLQVRIRYQGKYNLAPEERQLSRGANTIEGYRPCQWMVEYDSTGKGRVLTLTAAVCYDATDIRLASDLRGLSDVFVVPALNKDVSTFDQMSLALHYHMFQMVVVANSGLYGGSNAYVPYRDTHEKQIFHVHGQPQTAITFFEIDNISNFLKRPGQRTRRSVRPKSVKTWKAPPAGFR